MIRCSTCAEIVRPTLIDEQLRTLLEAQQLFLLCRECYVQVRVGYQRDRDLRAGKRPYQTPTIRELS